MRDEQVRRYARHILLADVGGLGQTALMVAGARLAVDGEPSAALIAATYLAAGGVGTIAVTGATESQRASLVDRGPDSAFVFDHVGQASNDQREPQDVPVEAAPVWWPSTDGDMTALAYWRGGMAAARWMAAIANR
jgi:hypothetical protein